MKKIFFLLMLFMLTLNFCSCSKDGIEYIDESTVEVTPLGEMLSILVEDIDIGEQIVYLKCDTDGSYQIQYCNLEKENDSSNITRSMDDNWHYAGTVKGKISALKLANKLSKILSGDRVVLLKIVPTGNNGEWKVYWKYDD